MDALLTPQLILILLQNLFTLLKNLANPAHLNNLICLIVCLDSSLCQILYAHL